MQCGEPAWCKMSCSGISGKDGDVKIGTTSINEIKKWSFNPKVNTQRYASNKTGGYKCTIPGTKEATGTLSGVYTATNSHINVIDVGTMVTLKLYITATLYFSVPAVITDYKLDVDLDNGEIVGWEASFESDGAWTNPTESMTIEAGGVQKMPQDVIDLVTKLASGVPMKEDELVKLKEHNIDIIS